MRCLIALLALSCAHPTKPATPSESPPATDPLREDVERLAADAMGGRGTLEPGGAMAAAFISERLSSLGLTPAPGQQDFLVPYTLYASGFDPARTHITTQLGEETRHFKAHEDFSPFPFSGEGELDAELVFAGYGITAPEYEWDDYEGLDVTGKIVIVLRHEPHEDDDESVFGGKESTDHAMFTTKARNALAHGAVGMLVVTDPLHHQGQEDFRPNRNLAIERAEPAPAIGADAADSKPTEAPADPLASFLALHVSQPMGAALLTHPTLSFEALQEAVDSGTKPSALSMPPLRVAASAHRIAEAASFEDHNVLGVLPGKRNDEWVVIGAHYDHLGMFAGEGDTVYNGADDNASGTAGVLSLAASLASLEGQLERSVAFAFFSGEEMGLLGSKAMVRDNIIPREQITFMLNLDMIGRTDADLVEVVGDAYATEVKQAVERANGPVGLDLTFGGTSYAGNSDHDSYFREDIPSLFFFTGLHEDYHQLTDHPEKLDYDRMHQILDVGLGLVREVASGAITPTFRHHVSWLGLVAQRVEEQAVIQEIDPDSRAAAAGLQVGDVITAVDAAPLDASASIGGRFRAVEPGTTIAVALTRDSEEILVEVERAKTGYLGVYPQAPTEESQAQFGLSPEEGIVLARVVPEGPAAAAGLMEGDILYRIGGYPVGVRDLSRRLARIGAGEKVLVMVIRGEERLTLTMMLGERPSR